MAPTITSKPPSPPAKNPRISRITFQAGLDTCPMPTNATTPTTIASITPAKDPREGILGAKLSKLRNPIPTSRTALRISNIPPTK